MKWRIVLGGLAALLTVLGGAACTVLVAGEAQRPPPPGLAEPVLTPIEIPFVHRWSRDTSHGPARAYLNRSTGRFVAVRLPDNAASIGARVRLEGVRVPVHQVIVSEGLTSDRTTQHTIGLPADGPAPTALVVEWPDGRQTRMADPPLGKPLRVPAPA